MSADFRLVVQVVVRYAVQRIRKKSMKVEFVLSRLTIIIALSFAVDPSYSGLSLNFVFSVVASRRT